MDIPFPKGVAEDFGFSDGGGARDAQNVRFRDPVTGRLRGGVRPGTPRYCSSQIASAKVAHIATITNAVTNQTIASLGNSLTQDWAKTNTVTGDTLEVRAGTQGDSYCTDGNTGILKRNRDGTTIWKVSLAAADKAHVVRALYVDATTPDNLGTDLVLAGVSSGGSSLTAKCWAYIQLNEGKVQKLWEMSVGGYVEEFVISKDKLHVLVNFPDKNRAYVIAYDDYLTNTPTEIRRWAVPYPANSIAASPLDGVIFTASDANTKRDVLPGNPKATMASEDWNIFDLPSYSERVWSNLDAMDVSTLSITPRNLAYPGSGDATAPPPDLLDGGNVLAWYDSSKQGRNLYQTAADLVSGGAIVNPASRGAIFRRNGAANGGPCLHFDGLTCGMISEIPGSVDAANKNENLSLIPSYKGAQYAVFIVGKFSADSIRRCLIGHGTTRWIGVNKQASATIGDTAVPGSMALIEPNTVAGDAAASASVPGAPSGPGNNPLAGGLPDSGFAVLTWVCDGGVHDVFGTATRSQWRVNGHPCDRWQSAPFSTTEATTLGYLEQGVGTNINALVGDVYQIVVLSDWSVAETKQYLTGDASGAKNYPDANWASAGDSYLERMEGWLAHRWGIAHELEGGKAGWLTMTAVAAGGETVTVGATTYTFVAPPAATNDVAPGATTLESITNLARAINGTGTPTTDYWRAGVPNADYRASMPVAINATANTYAICVRSRVGNGSGVGVFGETLAAAGSQWNSANASASIAGGGANTGWYPHPFYLERTNTSVGGPPRTAGAATTSNYWRLRSPHPILAAWDPSNGKCKSVLTSNFNDVSPTTPGAGSGVGGIGYGVRVSSTGQVFSCGPRADLVTLSQWAPNGFTADPVDARLVIWEAEAFSLLGTGYWMWGSGTTPASPGALGYAYPRMAVDKFDNLYLPYFGTGSASLVAFALAGAGSGNPTVRFTYSGLTDSNEAHAVAVDPTYPDFTGFTSIQRAEKLLLATRIEAAPTSRNTLFKLSTLSVTQAAGTPRTITAVAVAGSTVAKFTTSTVTSLGTLDSARNFVDSAALFGKLYLTDGRQVKVYDPVAGTFANHVATASGGIPKRCALIASWNASLVLARQAENPNQYYISAQGSPGDFDSNPYTINQAQAITGSDGSAGIPPDIINAFIPYSDDLAFLGGDHTIFRITGRPSPGGVGEIHLVSDSIGIAFGRAWCKDTRGVLYFFGSRGGVYRMVPGGLPQPLPGKIERRLQSIDLANYTVQMAWNDLDKGLHLAVCPFGNGGTVMEHYFWEEAIENWWPDTWQLSTIQPTCLAVMDGDSSTDRVVLFGTESGYVCKFSSASNADSTDYAIDSSVLIGPIIPKETPVEVIFSQLEAVLASDQHGQPWCNVYVTDTPDSIGRPVWSGQLEPGRSPFKNFKARGSYVFVEIQLRDKLQRWAFEQMTIHGVTPAGRKRKSYA